ncbi:HNH endonuclease [Synechococcus sp. 1G10]|uniref:HNH endonuclease n=1 Tax=Synechococcus sp. 1G10 TaxID=2025605 RepID=UPI003510FFE1
MKFVRANKALRDHRADRKRVYLFEALGHGDVSYIGEATYLGHHHEERSDTNDKLRQAIVFELALEPYEGEKDTPIDRSDRSFSNRRLRGKSLQELRQLAIAGAGREASVQQRRQCVRVRSAAVRQYVLERAAGVCEGCGEIAPFMTKRREPYLEPHHTTRLADGGPDHPGHVIALCPTCHRRVHHAHDGDSYNHILIEHLFNLDKTSPSPEE